MLNFTSCGWFFDEVSGIETVQILRYAARTIQLAVELDGVSLDDAFAKILATAPGNVLASGLEAYEKYAKTATVTLQRVGAHYAISSLFEDYPEEYQYGCYKVFGKQLHRETAGRSQLLTGCAKIQSDIMQEQFEAQFAAVYTGDHNVSCGVKPIGDSEGFRAMQAELRQSFDKGDLSETIRTLDAQFDGHIYSLWHLFRDAQREVVRKVLAPTFQTAEDMYRQIFQNNYPFLNFLQWVAIPLPRHFLDAAAFVTETDLKRLLAGDGMDLERLSKASRMPNVLACPSISPAWDTRRRNGSIAA
jgi:hypothetical protein